jgi:hypothetical protein
MTTFKSGALALAIIAMLTALPVSAKKADVVLETPGPDETLIYVMREGRFVGSGVKAWVAINDQTVARVKNKGYVVVRAPAGRITLNTAGQGVIMGAIALDDRPGEVVYAKFRPGESFVELDEAEAQEFLKKSKQSDPIDEIRPNNEEIGVLLNASRLGFDLMRPATDRPEPDETSATVTFLRRGDADELEFGIWGGHGFVATLGVFEAVTISVPPGDHFFLAGNVGKSVLKLEAEAGKRYFAWLDFGGMVGRVRLTPIEVRESDKLEKWLSDVTWVELDDASMSNRILERQKIVTDYIEQVIHKTETGESDFHLLSTDHAY